MSTDAKPRPALTIAQMDDLVDPHFRAEETGDLDAIAAGFTLDTDHDVAGRPGGVLLGGEQVVAFYEGLLVQLPIERFATAPAIRQPRVGSRHSGCPPSRQTDDKT